MHPPFGKSSLKSHKFQRFSCVILSQGQSMLGRGWSGCPRGKQPELRIWHIASLAYLISPFPLHMGRDRWLFIGCRLKLCNAVMIGDCLYGVVSPSSQKQYVRCRARSLLPLLWGSLLTSGWGSSWFCSSSLCTHKLWVAHTTIHLWCATHWGPWVSMVGHHISWKCWGWGRSQSSIQFSGGRCKTHNWHSGKHLRQ